MRTNPGLRGTTGTQVASLCMGLLCFGVSGGGGVLARHSMYGARVYGNDVQSIFKGIMLQDLVLEVYLGTPWPLDHKQDMRRPLRRGRSCYSIGMKHTYS